MTDTIRCRWKVHGTTSNHPRIGIGMPHKISDKQDDLKAVGTAGLQCILEIEEFLFYV